VEACNTDFTTQEWEMENVLSLTSWNSLKEALIAWIEVYQKINGSTANKLDGDCTASEEESGSWDSLRDLMEECQVSGILKYAWPRINQID